ncbi:MAG: cation-transporting P-type ATPase [Woeseia sp.]|nr:cation-transporting P-type ATPase [Woeseia sp.]MBT8098058.1 cation-transporting P-type ATPase [Woeseia sp.]
MSKSKQHDPQLSGNIVHAAESAQTFAFSRPPWALSTEQLVQEATVDATRGLSIAEVIIRRHRYGTNQLRAVSKRQLLAILVDQFKSLVILLLLFASALALAFSDVAEGIAILAVVIINATIGFSIEWRATRSMEALRRMARVETVVLRDGRLQKISAEDLVPGDIVKREAGDIVSADIRLLKAAKLQANESALTGEAAPVAKELSAIAEEAPLTDRSNMLYCGTVVTRGTGAGIVVATGRATELGRIAELVATAEPEETPLEKRLESLAARLVKVVLVIALLIAISGIVSGRDLFLSIEIAIALGVAAIPEGLPIVATIALARGMWRMAKRNAVIARLSAVETLGTTSVIVTDKTGTLTENRMTVTELCVANEFLALEDFYTDPSGECSPQETAVKALLRVGVLCNNAALREEASTDTQAVGDPTEVALLLAAARCGVRQAECQRAAPELREIPFEPETKLMATLHADKDRVFYAVKGAPEAILEHCSKQSSSTGDTELRDADRDALLQQAQALGERGLRTLALASKIESDELQEPYRDLTLLGFVGLEDPARPGVAEAIERCRHAGIRVVMVTGDHAATAREIARDTGILDASVTPDLCINGTDLTQLLRDNKVESLSTAQVFSRATPEQKLRLIGHFQNMGDIVAMTGDGVNDAPALRKADIGIAMGIRGTAVAKEAAAMVLQDDEFGTIVDAVAQGRAIYENIRKFVVYLLSCNISEILIVTLATLAGAPLPLLPLQILFLNLVTDVFPALALGVGKGSSILMQQAPRPAHEPLVTRQHWGEILAYGLLISMVVLVAMATAIQLLGFDTQLAVTVSFGTLALAQLWHVFNMRSVPSRFFMNEVSSNPWIWLALALCLVLTVAAVKVESFSSVLSLQDPGPAGWLLIVVMSLVPLLAGGPLRVLMRRMLKNTDA